MLRIENNKSYFTIKPKYIYSQIEKNSIIKLPILNNKIKIPYDIWYHKNKEDIDLISDKFINEIFELKSEKFIVHFKIKKIKEEFIQMLYKTSYNTYKDWEY